METTCAPLRPYVKRGSAGENENLNPRVRKKSSLLRIGSCFQGYRVCVVFRKIANTLKALLFRGIPKWIWGYPK